MGIIVLILLASLVVIKMNLDTTCEYITKGSTNIAILI